ncbi:MAG: CoA pyrophosphatase [Myxococcales bacterium]|nr:CoA pyrophosphatase [Myxococcales bacterium]
MPRVTDVRRLLADHRPTTKSTAGRDRASVAVVLREGAGRGSEVLFIERARKPGDPWSGHMAFPGGRAEAVDPSPSFTAARETLEEVGLDLVDAEILGRLDDLEGRRDGKPVGMVISAFVYHVAEPSPLLLQKSEVEAAFWFPVRELADPERHVPYRWRHSNGMNMEMPGIRVGDSEPHVVWGLTYRFVEILMGLIERPLPARWDRDTVESEAEPRDPDGAGRTDG